MKIDSLVIDSLFEESLSDENTDIDEMINEIFSSSKGPKKSIRIEVIAPSQINEGEDVSEEEIAQSREKLESMLKEAVGSDAVEKVLGNIESEEKFSDYIDDAIYMRNQDVNLSGIEGALIRGCRIEKRLNAYRNKSEQCQKECEKLMEYEFFQSLTKVMEEESKGFDIFDENKKVPYIVTEEEYLIIKDNIENFYKERIELLKDSAVINEVKSYIIVGETTEGEERIVGFIDNMEEATKLFEGISLNNKSLSLATMEFLEEEDNKIILNYNILETIK